jgi:hypothetical protein
MKALPPPLPSLNFQEEASMDSATISRLMDIIPERVARVQSGTVFAPENAGSCRHPERLALVMQHLHWLTPLTYLTKDEQQALGLLTANGRLMHSGDQEEELSDDIDDVVEHAAEHAEAAMAPGMPAEEVGEQQQEAMLASSRY